MDGEEAEFLAHQKEQAGVTGQLVTADRDCRSRAVNVEEDESAGAMLWMTTIRGSEMSPMEQRDCEGGCFMLGIASGHSNLQKQNRNLKL